jgi:hypothetical protein
VDILQVIKDSLYGCFKNDQMTVQLDETNDGAFLSIVNWDVYGDDQPESLFIPKEKKNDFILYLKNMIERLEKL